MPEALRNQIVTNFDFDKLEQLIRNRRRGGYFKEDWEQYWPGFGLKRLWQHVCRSLNCPQRIRAEVKHVIGARLNEFYNAYNDCIISDENLPSLDIRDAFQDYTPDYAQKSYLEGQKLFANIAHEFNKKHGDDDADVDYLLKFIDVANQALDVPLSLENSVDGVVCDYFVKSVETKLSKM
ncbi:hypothetical protein [Lacticaseibacillus kribbianus]|uniref:hypothetical protein n=1 Tax=Lacticaseibacillus kribbianus TaxID=2926292 RepID=UPI001CD3C91C|nr:hypothetical protein [Lacticaseibacillus kribbianus]